MLGGGPGAGAARNQAAAAAAAAAAAGVGAAGGAGGAAPGGYQRVGGDDDVVGAPQGEILNAAFAPVHAGVPVDPAALQQLMAMGFSEPRARAALIATYNNLPAASNLLLGS